MGSRPREYVGDAGLPHPAARGRVGPDPSALASARPCGRWGAPPPAVGATDLAPRPIPGDGAHVLVDSGGARGDACLSREGADAPPDLRHRSVGVGVCPGATARALAPGAGP